MQKIKFINRNKTHFYDTLKERVDKYFIDNHISKHANITMVAKTIVMLSLYFIPLIIIYTNSVNIIAMWLCSAIMGVGLAGIGMGIMHDANHDAYSSKNKLNKLIAFALTIGGGNNRNWRTQHNILHHTYTNIHEYDKDIDNKVIMRFSPAGKKRFIQRFQIIYVFFFYAIMTLYWTTAKDIVQYFQFIKNGLHRDTLSQKIITLLSLLLWKTIYFTYIIILPITILDIPWQYVLIGFLTLHTVAGLILSIVFQLAHVVEGAKFPEPDKKGNIENEWAIHQIETTADFARNNWFVTFFVGGLNFQIEHHLFPRICHIHYPALAPIVESTAKEFGLKYIYNDTVGKAFKSHLSMISKLGNHTI